MILDTRYQILDKNKATKVGYWDGFIQYRFFILSSIQYRASSIGILIQYPVSSIRYFPPLITGMDSMAAFP